MQLDTEEKGFSFMRDGPLDMRMDPRSELSAKEIVNKWSEKRLGEIIRDFGEDPRWKRGAKAIVEARRKAPIQTTKQLAEVLTNALVTKTRGRLHPATLVFQALRIFVNGELDHLKLGLGKAINLLATGGAIGVISFHRLEDKIVKEMFKQSGLKVLTKKPLEPTVQEVKTNRRSSSAKLRFVEKEEQEE